MRGKQKYEDRLSEIVVGDKRDNIFGLDKLLKSEILNVMRNYFIVTSDDVCIDIWAESGIYKFNLQANVRGVKKIKKIIE